MKELQVNSSRLQNQIDALASISEAPFPVVTRVLFSEADLRGRAFVKKLCHDLQLSVREDGIGNLFARWVGKDPGLPAVATGSHIDAIPNAGRYDGVVGVLGALEAMRSLREAGFSPVRSIELIVFTAEEPTRFGIGCLGSRLLAGTVSADKLASLRDSEGRDVGHWLREAGYASLAAGAFDAAKFTPSLRVPQSNYSAFIELHIEQGPILEQENVSIGVVEKIAAPGTLRVELIGVGGHAGAVLMPQRHDALLAGAEIALAVEKAALQTGSPDTVATTGVFRIAPGAVNSVPCSAYLEIDLRDTNVETRDAALQQIERAVPEVCRRRGIQFKLERLNVDAPGLCHPALVAKVLQICAGLKISAKKMISRAYHDSLFLVRICPTTMIFIPCRGGVSHRPDEYSSPEQISDGVRVLARTLAELSRA